MSTPTFELDRSPAAFIATLEVDNNSPMHVSSLGSTRSREFWTYGRLTFPNPGCSLPETLGRPKAGLETSCRSSNRNRFLA